MNISIELNGQKTEFSIKANESLLDLLRRSGMLSVKRGCQTGECGSCSVLLDGQLIPTCITLAAQADGHSILTTEGLSERGELHPIQAAFIETGAIQCGYCIPSKLLATKALLDKEKYPSLEQARETIGASLCRCTGYVKQVEAIMRAAALLRGEPVPPLNNHPAPAEEIFPFFSSQSYQPPTAEPSGTTTTATNVRVALKVETSPSNGVVGASEKKVDALRLAKGRPSFTDDFTLPGMLYAAMLTSPHPHARIRNIDATKARALPGVRTVLTYKDIPRVIFAPGCQSYPNPKPYDQVSLDNKVRHIGDKVAVVAADTLEIAREAIKLIEVDYELLPAVFDAEEALKEGAPVIHDETDAIGIKDAGHNLVTTIQANVGDVDKALKESDYTFERTYVLQQVQQTPIEPHVTITYWDEDDRLTIRTGNQAPYHMRRIMSQIVGLPVSRIRVIKPRMGGGFGGKMDIITEDLAVHLTIATGRPVRLEFTREQEFTTTRSRHPAKITYRAGVNKDGTLKALEMTVVENTGAYGVQGQTVCNLIGARGLSTYRCPNLRFDSKIAYTNRPVPSAFRGFGGPQGQFAMESMMDEMAAALHLDPVEFRMKNAVRAGDDIPIMSLLGEGGLVAQTVHSSALPQCVEQAAKAIQWERRKDPSWKIDPQRPNIRRGLGMCILMHGTSIPGLQMSGAILKMNDDGSFNLLIGAADLGNGSDTVLGQIAAETLGIPLSKVIVFSSDTDITPFDVGAYASTTTYIAGNAVKKTAEQVRQQLFERTALMLKTTPDGMVARDEHVFAADGRSVSLTEIAIHSLHTADQQQIMAAASHMSMISPPAFGSEFAEVEVDIETGEVRAKKIVLAVDCGTVINPQTAMGQMEGGQTQALGYALCEEMAYDDNGKLLTTRFGDYHIFQADEMPEMVSLLVPSYEEAGPYGAKGLGEIVTEGVAPAIADAVFDAVGVRIRSLPILPEKVWRELQKK